MCEFLLTVLTCTVLLPYSYWFIFTGIKFRDFQFNTRKQKIVQNLNVWNLIPFSKTKQEF